MCIRDRLPAAQALDTETAEFNKEQLKQFERELQQYRLEPDDIAGEEIWNPEESEVSSTTEWKDPSIPLYSASNWKLRKLKLFIDAILIYNLQF